MRGTTNAPPQVPAAPPEEPSRYCTFCKASFRMEILRCPRDGAPVEVMPQDPLLGEVLSGRYRIVATLGSGGMGRVYEALVLGERRKVAVKVLHGDLAADEKMVARFEREARAISRLSSPNIVAIVDFGTTSQGLLYLVMELLDGRPLHEAIAKEGPFSVERSMHICRQLADALGHAHDRGLIHRDLKPANVIISERNGDPNFVTILDFGLARMTEVTDPKDAELLTSMGVIRGTPEFMSPEQARGLELDRRSDLYALGVLLFLMLTQRFPFPRPKSRLDVLTMHVMTPPYPVSKFVQVPDPVEQVVAKLLAKEPEDRYQDGKQLIEDIDGLGRKRSSGRDTDEEEQPTRIFSLSSIAAPVVPTPAAAAKNNRWLLYVIGGGALGGVLLAVLALWLSQGPTPVAPPPTTSAPAASLPASEPFLSAPQVPSSQLSFPKEPATAPVGTSEPSEPLTPKTPTLEPKTNPKPPKPVPGPTETPKEPEGKSTYDAAKSKVDSALRDRGLSAGDLSAIASDISSAYRDAKSLADKGKYDEAASKLAGLPERVDTITLNAGQLIAPKLDSARAKLKELEKDGADVAEYKAELTQFDKRLFEIRSSGGAQREIERLNRDVTSLLSRINKLR